MDFGIGFILINIMLLILDFFFGIVYSYGFVIIVFILVICLGFYFFSVG